MAAPVTIRRVLVVTPSLSRGGAERHAVWLATSLDPRQWSAHVVSFDDGPLRQELLDAGVPVEVVSPPGGFRGVAASVAAVRDAVDRVRPAVVSGHHIRTEVAIRGALRRRPLPYLAWKHTYGHVGHRGMRERLFERATGGLVTAYGAVCHTQVRYLTDGLGLPEDKIAVLPNAVPTPAPVAAPPAAEPTVLMAAAMRADKDHASVIAAWPTVRAAIPGATLLLAGDGPCRSDLEARARSLGVGGSVRFLGTRSDVPDLLARSQLLVLASYAVECFPYAVLEAMSAGRGVVSTDVAGLPEMVDDGVTGRLVVPRVPSALAHGIIEGLSDGGVRAHAWGAAGRDRVGTVFTLDAWSEQVGELLDGLAGDVRRDVRTTP